MSKLLNRIWGRAANEGARDITPEMFLAELTTEHAAALEHAQVENVPGLSDALVLHVHKHRSVAARTGGRPEATLDLMAILRGASMCAHYAGRLSVNVEDVIWSLKTAITSGHARGPGMQALARVWPELSKPDPVNAIGAEIAGIRTSDFAAVLGAIAALRAGFSNIPTADDLQRLRDAVFEEISKVRADVVELDERWTDPHGRKTKKPNRATRPLAPASGGSH